LAKNDNTFSKTILWARNMISDTDLFARSEVEILPHLLKRGYRIFFLSGYAKSKSKSQDSGIHLISIPVGENNFPLKYHLIFALVQFFFFPYYIVKVQPDYIIIDWDSIFGLMPMLPICRLMSIKVVLDIRSTPTPIKDSRQQIGLRSCLLNIAFNISIIIAKEYLDGMTIITDLMKNEICTNFRINPACVGVWSSGVSPELFFDENHNYSGLEMRKKFGLIDKFVVLYHGGFSESRGLIDAINSMAILKTRRSNIVLFLLGRGSVQMASKMKKLIRDKRIQENVIIHDSVDHNEVPDYISMCDVGLVPLLDLPQWRNQCPLKLVEYLALKKTVILTDIPCHRRIIGANECGFFLSSVSPDGIAEAIAFAFDNKEKLEHWGAEGRAIVEKEYTWPRIAERLDDYLQNIEEQTKTGDRLRLDNTTLAK
jgi:glycosyltransferase involved in cell wall biosynthesis